MSSWAGPVRSRQRAEPGALRPNLRCRRCLAIDGSTAMVGRDDVELAPTITWKPPAIGEASVHPFRIVQLVKEPEREYHDILAGSFLTSQTEARIPAGVLQPGGQYYLSSSRWQDSAAMPDHAPSSRGSPLVAELCSRVQRSLHTGELAALRYVCPYAGSSGNSSQPGCFEVESHRGQFPPRVAGIRKARLSTPSKGQQEGRTATGLFGLLGCGLRQLLRSQLIALMFAMWISCASNCTPAPPTNRPHSHWGHCPARC